jgi:hypothetical protein
MAGVAVLLVWGLTFASFRHVVSSYDELSKPNLARDRNRGRFAIDGWGASVSGR